MEYDKLNLVISIYFIEIIQNISNLLAYILYLNADKLSDMVV